MLIYLYVYAFWLSNCPSFRWVLGATGSVTGDKIQALIQGAQGPWGQQLAESVPVRGSITARCSGVGPAGPRVSAGDSMGQMRVSASALRRDDGLVYCCNNVFHTFSSEAL